MSGMNSYQSRLVVALVALSLSVATGACDSGGDGESEQGSPSVGEQVSAGSGGGESDEGGGTASIDHGGITSIPDDPSLAEKGKELFDKKGCQSCHKMDQAMTGPALGGVTERREPKWIARMILHPDQMLKKDPTAKKLLAEHATKMPNQNVSPEEAKALIAYLATQSNKGGSSK